jgi:FkbM family methyltransferase
MFDTPILFLIFNRPETTIQVMDKIRVVKPSRLYVAADGPRLGKEGEIELCKRTRQIVLEEIDWECELKFLFREENLGCGVAPSTAITWFFEQEEAGIILEDDCLPSLSFFTYAAYCLKKYYHSPEIMHIGGNNFLNRSWGEHAYFYSAYNHVWGWATWRRSWELYNFNLLAFDKGKLYRSLNKYFPKEISNGWLSFYESLAQGLKESPEHKCDFWDYQWSFCIWLNQGLCIYPNVNLVSNIGFGPGATHTFDVSHNYSNLPSHELSIISSPPQIKRNKEADIITSEVVFSIKSEPNPQKSAVQLQQLNRSGLRSMKRFATRFIPQAVKRSIRAALYQEIGQPEIKKSDELLELERICLIPRYKPGTTTLLTGSLGFVDSASLIFMYDEIFKKQIYAFNCPEAKPYIIDCGANIGLSILYFKSLFPEATIVAFEPDPKVYQVLQANLAGFSDVVLRERALWSEETSMVFFVEGADGGSLSEGSATVEKVEVLTERLSTYVTRKVNFLKIDIEGAELAVLAECESKLHLVQNIFIEFHSFVESRQELAALVAILERNGFRYHINSPGLTSGQPFMDLNTYNGMDMQLNIYAFKR